MTETAPTYRLTDKDLPLPEWSVTTQHRREAVAAVTALEEYADNLAEQLAAARAEISELREMLAAEQAENEHLRERLENVGRQPGDDAEFRRVMTARK